MTEETLKIELEEWEIGDLIGVLERHKDLLERELDATNDQSEEWMLRTQQRKTDHLLEKVNEIYEERSK